MTIELNTTDINRVYLGNTQINRVYSGNNIVFGSGSTTGAVLSSNFDDSIFISNAGGSQATAGITFKPNGTVEGVNVVQLNWYSAISAGIGASYWLLVNTPSSGTFTAGTIGTRQQLSSDRAYTAVTTGAGPVRQKAVTATYQIWDAATGGTQVGSGTITLSANAEDDA